MASYSPLKAVRAKCLECSGDQPKEVRLCEIMHCALYPYRFGKNPNRKGIGRGASELSSEPKVELSGQI